ncbi:head-tail adaptor [Camelimonas lactis]|uniref:Head-tail adaptor n=1 Tax=Camelimonas lactis TaxID=659006 RepID=A0A4R2GXD2_9HYPH|nr:head-tail adaptor [Camelimonas lactis]
MQAAGVRYRHRVRFEVRQPQPDDGSGNVIPEAWTAVVTVWAGWRPKFGREQIVAGALESTAQGVLTVLAFSTTMAIRPDHRVVFVAGPYRGRTFGVHSVTPTIDGREIEFLLVEGDS